MADVERTVDVLVGLRAIGVRTALDDFGAGHAGLGHLKQLHVDVLKIDRSFVGRIAHDERDAAIVRSLVDLARRLGVRVVAEGVDSVEGCTLLADGAATRSRATISRARCRRTSSRNGCGSPTRSIVPARPPERYVPAMDEQTTKDHIQAHADAVVRGDMDTVIADLSEELQPQAPQLAAGLPMPVTEAEVAQPRLRRGRERGADPLHRRQRRGHPPLTLAGRRRAPRDRARRARGLTPHGVNRSTSARTNTPLGRWR